jgi:hypothetical protein
MKSLREYIDLIEKQQLEETASAGATSSANVTVNAVYPNKPVKSVSALDQDEVSLFGGPMENFKGKATKKAAIIKRR